MRTNALGVLFSLFVHTNVLYVHIMSVRPLTVVGTPDPRLVKTNLAFVSHQHDVDLARAVNHYAYVQVSPNDPGLYFVVTVNHEVPAGNIALNLAQRESLGCKAGQVVNVQFFNEDELLARGEPFVIGQMVISISPIPSDTSAAVSIPFDRIDYAMRNLYVDNIFSQGQSFVVELEAIDANNTPRQVHFFVNCERIQTRVGNGTVGLLRELSGILYTSNPRVNITGLPAEFMADRHAPAPQQALAAQPMASAPGQQRPMQVAPRPPQASWDAPVPSAGAIPSAVVAAGGADSTRLLSDLIFEIRELRAEQAAQTQQIVAALRALAR